MSNERREPWRDRFDDLKEAYALGALTEDERREFEGYLEEHPEMQAEVDELVSVANLLALAPQEHDPPPELRRELLERIGGATGPSLAKDPSSRAGLRRLFGPAGLAAAVAVLVVIGLFVWNATLLGELQDRQTYELQGSGVAQDVRGEVVEIGGDRAVLVAEDLPPAPEGRVYEAWLVRGDVSEPAGLFEPLDGGSVVTLIEGSLEGADAVAVTTEPSGGSSTPTTEPLITATL